MVAGGQGTVGDLLLLNTWNTFLPLHELAGEAHVGVGDGAGRFDAPESVVVGEAVRAHEESGSEGNAAADALRAVDEDGAARGTGAVNKVEDVVQNGCEVLVGRVGELEREVV